MNLNLVRENLDNIKKNLDFSARGEEIIRSGKVRLGPFPATDYKLDWYQNPLDNRTWQWRWGSLSALLYIIAYHQITSDSSALNVGIELIEEWSKQFSESRPGDENLSEFVWHDHGTALRAEHILLFLGYLSELPSRQIWEGGCAHFVEASASLLERHASILADNAFYSAHTNHGLEQARVLLLLASVFENGWEHAISWQETALARLQSELDFAFTSEGVHVENSPAYHIFVFKTFISIVQTYTKSGHSELAKAFLPKAKKILEYIVYVLRPDAHVPIIGDTEKLRPTDAFKELLGESLEYQEFRYAITGGKSGIKPRFRFKIYPVSGYAIYRDTWDNRRALHGIFKAGALSSYHRQEDEGNLVVYAFGEDWLIDSGMYNYNHGDPIRKYVRSRFAHNVAILDGTAYKKNWPELKNSWTLIDERLTGTNNQSTMTFHGLVGASTERTTQFEPRRLTVTDSLVCLDGTPRTARMLWHVDNQKDIEVIDKSTVRVRSRKSGTIMTITTTGDTLGTISVRGGISGTKVVSVSSDRANKYLPSSVIEFVCESAINHELKTVISFSQ
ncbi:hypothetical protein CQ050_18030 [Achromobacter sp. MYb9]|nr:hypothetical protein CQ050_18030 [Achromobacter sp. MYb9]